jgi:hypothetical protein
MRGNPQAISGRLPRAAPSRRWSRRIIDAIQNWRGRGVQRHEVIERVARDERRAHARGQFVPEREHRVRPW